MNPMSETKDVMPPSPASSVDMSVSNSEPQAQAHRTTRQKGPEAWCTYSDFALPLRDPELRERAAFQASTKQACFLFWRSF